MRRSTRITARPATAPESNTSSRTARRPPAGEDSPTPSYEELAAILRKVMTPNDGKVAFRHPVILSPYLRVRGFRWYRCDGMFDDDNRTTVALDFQPTPFGGLHGIAHASTTDESGCINELLQRTVSLSHCNDCCGIYQQGQLVDHCCPGCHMARHLCPNSQDCSICQEPVERSYVTKCGHHFHFACLSQVVETVRHSRQSLPSWVDPASKAPLLCPNCRASIETEFLPYLAADDS